MTRSNANIRPLLTVKVIHLIFLALVPIAALILVLLPIFGSVPEFFRDDPILILIEIIMVGFSLVILAVAFLWPRLARWNKPSNRTVSNILIGHLVRISLLESIAVYGLVLRLLGSAWYIVLPLFILSAVALVLTFPTDKRFARWQGEQKPSR
jgi:hypothetical protein